MTKGHWCGEIWNRRKSGEVYAEMIDTSAVRDAAGQTKHYVALFSDITPMKMHQQQLEHIAHYDELTGLPNRLLLSDRLEQAMAQTQRHGGSLAVAYLDLDGFKAINDEHGHSVGDALLVAIAGRMNGVLREVDTLARIGGDEFVAVLVDLEHPTSCEPLIERLLRAAADPVMVGQAMLHISASIGVTIYPQDEANANAGQLLRHADQAMYVAKQLGRNRYSLFDVAQDAAMKTEQENLADIRRALDRHEFVLHYQPKVNLKTRAVIGVEALIRWQHPQRGLLRPSEFMPIVENHAYGVALGEWVIDAALAQMAEWHGQHFDMPVSVNIAAYHLQRDGFVPRLRERFAAHPTVRPGQFGLEVLESSALEDMGNACKIMQACCEMGVHFALDDFGTGYSSLTYLKRLPVDMLKIDQSFIHDMLIDQEDLSIIEGVIGLARSFHRQVIAEGVETAGHGERLMALGCDLAQGYAIAQPMPEAELPGWVAAWQQHS
jgi:diguanylate cyclase (GGDEF)-like protein